MKRRTKELGLIAVASCMLAFEMVAIAGALPVVRRAVTRTSQTNVHVIAVSHEKNGQWTTHRTAVVTKAESCPMAKALKQAL